MVRSLAAPPPLRRRSRRILGAALGAVLALTLLEAAYVAGTVAAPQATPAPALAPPPPPPPPLKAPAEPPATERVPPAPAPRVSLLTRARALIGEAAQRSAQGEQAAALDALDRAEALADDHALVRAIEAERVSVHEARARARLDAGDAPGAAQALQQALARVEGSSSRSLALRHQLTRIEGVLRAAAPPHRPRRPPTPGDRERIVTLLVERGTCKLKIGDVIAGALDLVEALALDPAPLDRIVARSRVGCCFTELSRFVHAAGARIRQDPGNPAPYVLRALYTWFWVELAPPGAAAPGHLALARDDLAVAESLHPDHASLAALRAALWLQEAHVAPSAAGRERALAQAADEARAAQRRWPLAGAPRLFEAIALAGKSALAPGEREVLVRQVVAALTQSPELAQWVAQDRWLEPFVAAEPSLARRMRSGG